MKELDNSYFQFKPLFYLLNMNRNELSSIAVQSVSDIGFEGLCFKEDATGWEVNPIKIGRGFISLAHFDFTEQFEEAKIHASIREVTKKTNNE